MAPRATSWPGIAILGLVVATVPDAAWAQQQPVGIVGTTPSNIAKSALDLLAYSVVPDGTLSALQIDRRGEGDNDIGVTLGQLGAGFTWSDSFRLYLEGFLGYARYDPRFVFSDGQAQRSISTRWDQFSATVGVGYDFVIAKNLYLRPILNVAIATVTTDATLAASLVEFSTNEDIAFLENGKMNAYGLGGALMLAYYDHLPAREIDIELRTTDLYLQTFGDTSAAVEGSSNSITVSLWGRLRWPTGLEAFDRPIRWVAEATHSHFLGDPQAAFGFEYLTKVGGGIEFDTSAMTVGALGLYLRRARLVGRYVFGDNVSGFSVGIGVSF